MSSFDTEAGVVKYEEWFKRNPLIFESELKAVESVLPAGYGFEIGIGSGIFAERLGIRMGNDISEAMLERAASRGRMVYHCSGDKLPFHDGYFDFILMVTTLCFLSNPQDVFRESFRVLNRNGRFIIGFIPSDSSLGRKYGVKKSKSLFYKDAVFYSKSQVNDLLCQSGFDIESSVHTLTGNIKDIKEVQDPQPGTEKGSFVVVKGVKKSL